LALYLTRANSAGVAVVGLSGARSPGAVAAGYGDATSKSPHDLDQGPGCQLVDACANVLDRLVVDMLYGTGLRVAELRGLRLSDLPLVPSAAHLGCKVAGAHLHVVRREDKESGAMATSAYPRSCRHQANGAATRSVPAERDSVPEVAESDYLLVNLWRPPLGRASRPHTVEQLLVRLSAKVGSRTRPHMLGHSFASEVALATKGPALVKELLGHHSVISSDVYMHSRGQVCVRPSKAKENQGRLDEAGPSLRRGRPRPASWRLSRLAPRTGGQSGRAGLLGRRVGRGGPAGGPPTGRVVGTGHCLPGPGLPERSSPGWLLVPVA
jgi:hypothetical protein